MAADSIDGDKVGGSKTDFIIHQNDLLGRIYDQVSDTGKQVARMDERTARMDERTEFLDQKLTDHCKDTEGDERRIDAVELTGRLQWWAIAIIGIAQLLDAAIGLAIRVGWL